jgi:hypothetical protein
MKRTTEITEKRAREIVKIHYHLTDDMIQNYSLNEIRESLKHAGFRNIKIK